MGKSFTLGEFLKT